MFCSYGLARLVVQARQQDWRSAFFNYRLDKNHAPTKKRIFKVVYLHFEILMGNKIRLRRACNSLHGTRYPPLTKQVFACARPGWPIMAFYRGK